MSNQYICASKYFNQKVETFETSSDNINFNPLSSSNSNSSTTSCKKQPSSDPTVWGPSAWKFFHIVAENYPVVASPLCQEKTKGFIRSIPFILPCADCSSHAFGYIQDIEARGIDKVVSGRDELAKFFIDFHNFVNKRHGKKIYNYEEARKMYV